MENPKFDFIFLGQSILKYQVPLDIYRSINHIYESNFSNLEPANGQLVGKIEKEHSLFYNGADQTKMKNHNKLPTNVNRYSTLPDKLSKILGNKYPSPTPKAPGLADPVGGLEIFRSLRRKRRLLRHLLDMK
mgnify:CR=1 FL=1